MSFHCELRLSDEQLDESVTEGVPAFISAVDARLRQDYPDYTIGTWDVYDEGRWVQWNLSAVTGAAHGFCVEFRLPAKDPNTTKLKVVRTSRILRFLAGGSVMIAFILAVESWMDSESGGYDYIMVFFIVFFILYFISMLLAGIIARVSGKAIPEEELQKIGQAVLETLK